MSAGKVILVGAGPGDVGLITVKGLEYIKQADVIIYDNLVNKDLLKHCSIHCELIYVGKQAGKHLLPQDEINKLLVKKASENKLVVRLKGGDPFIFGRGGEEALELAAHHISFEVVPGITAGTAAAAYAGIPMTHRGHATAMTFITGHEDETKTSSSINWEHLSKSSDTIVFYMGVKNLPHIVGQLLKYGKSSETPVAIIRWATYNKQETLTSTLAEVIEVTQGRKLMPPAIIIIGSVVALREQIKWFENKPLFGKRIVVTRSRTQASQLCVQLQHLGAEVIELPTIEIKPFADLGMLDNMMQHLSTFSWIVFTSTNSVEIFFERLKVLNLDARSLHANKIAAMGEETTKTLQAYGVLANLIPALGTSEGMINAFKIFQERYENETMLIPTSEIAREYLPRELAALGAIAISLPIYQNTMPDYSAEYLDSIFKQPVDLFTFTSSSTVENMAKLLETHQQTNLLKEIPCVSIGPTTSATARRLEINLVAEADEANIKSLVDCIVAYCYQ